MNDIRTKLSPHRTKKGSTLFVLPNEGNNNPRSESFEGVWGDFFKSPPKKKLFQKVSPNKPRPRVLFDAKKVEKN